MGGAMTAIVDDASALIWNPAGLARMVKPEVGATNVTLFQDTNYQFYSGGLPTKRFGGFAAAYINQTSGGFQARQGPNDAPTSFSVGQNALLAGWGVPLPLGLPIDAGVTFKAVKESVYNNSASGTGADFGLDYHPDPRLQLGLSVQNVVPPRLTFVSDPVSYARAVDLSAGSLWALPYDWNALLAVRLSRVDGQSVAPSAGMELQYGHLGALRLGVQDKGMSMGIGLTIGNTSVDYAALLNDLGVSNIISLTQRFGQTQEELEDAIRKGVAALTADSADRLSKAYVRRAEEELDAGRVSEGLHDLESASLLSPGDNSIHERIRQAGQQWEQSLKKQMVERTAALAYQQQEEGNLVAARQYWLSVAELDPGRAEAQQALARIDEELSADDRARLDAARKAAQDAQAAQALASAGALRDSGRLRDAWLAAHRALLHLPGSTSLEAFQAQVQRQIDALDAAKTAEASRLIAGGDVAGAVRAAGEALAQKPDDGRLAAEARTWRSELRKKISPEERRQLEQLYYRAVDQYLKGNFAAAGELARQVMQADPSSEAARTLREKVEVAQR